MSISIDKVFDVLLVCVCVCVFFPLFEICVRETKKIEVHSPFHSTNVDDQFFFLTTGRRFSVDVAVVVVVVVSHHGFVVFIAMLFSESFFKRPSRFRLSHVSGSPQTQKFRT